MILTVVAKLSQLLALVWMSAVPAPAGMVESGGWSCNVEGATEDSPGVSVERVAWLMGTEMRAVACADSRWAGLLALEAAFTEVRHVESRLSTWLEDSELSRLNSTPPGQWADISRSTLDLLEEVRDWAKATDGAFDPAVGALLDAWDMRGRGKVPEATELDRALEVTGIEHVELDPSNGRARRLRAVRFDAGAFGKGAGLRAAANSLAASGVRSAVLEFGGQIEIVSSARDNARWTVDVADPVNRDETAVRLHVGRASSIATTGASERFVEVDGQKLGHVIDPRDGHPVPAWGSATVVAADAVTADVLSTALFVMGAETAENWSRDLDVGVLLLSGSGAERVVYRNEALRMMETSEW